MKTFIRKLFIIALLLFFLSPLFSQVLSKKELIKAVEEADISYYYDQDYENAASQYQSLLKYYPDNSNLIAKLGICYLSIDGKKSDALKLLIRASANVVRNDTEYLEYGEKAPLDTYLYLAVAYHQNDSLEKALLLYFDAKKRLGGTEIFREDYIDKQIRDCRYAMEMEKNPLGITTNLFIPWLSEYPGACNPVLSRNDSVFVFTHKIEEETRIFCSYKADRWMRPSDITKQLGNYDRFYSNSITADGKLLIIYLDDGGDGNLYYSQRNDTTWTKIKSVGKPVNSIYWQSHGYITPDGKSLYFSSNRPGGEGELDIWKSEKNHDGKWSQPVNCGNAINTPYNEDTPFFDPETGTLLFSSAGHLGMGGYDVYRSVYQNGKWTKPTGMPFAFNNTTENSFFILKNNAPGYITSLYNEKTKSRNIYALSAGEVSEKKIVAHGTVNLQDGLAIDPEKTHIRLYDQKTGSIIKNITLSDTASFNFEVKPGDFKILISHIGYKTDTINMNIKKEPKIKTSSLIDTAVYEFEIKPGDYQFFVSHSGYKTDTINLNVPVKFPGNYIAVSSTLIPDKVYKGDFLLLKNILFDFDSYKLTEEATSILENLKSILFNYPDLKIEVAGYTDAKGSASHNRKLADDRAQNAISYLTATGISATRFLKKSYGESDFVAININKDGSDNPEGRRYNRRVTFGIVDPGTGVIIRQESYTPERLRHPFSLKYSIVLLKTAETVSSDFFRTLNMNNMPVIRPVKTESGLLYILGGFKNKTDASIYLLYAKEKGFKGAYIVTQYDINNPSDSLLNRDLEIKQVTVNRTYTIQLAAARESLNLSMFKGVEGVREIISPDGYYRYIYGDFNSFKIAKAALIKIHESGFKDAFIRELKPLIQ